ncbi:YncE family protein [Chondromyces crocatus]|uniref:YncE family protein n=1 Tax=Chondromyces crocatus TaxID=52 RepID=UPI00067AA0AB|nr:YncE family protein [Chondromyces crocatus]
MIPFITFGLASLAGACSDDVPKGPPTSSGAGAGGSVDPEDPKSCAADPLPLQNPRAHTLGETFYLPRVLDDADCAQLTWQLASAPQNSQNLVHAKGAPEPRFTPDVAGEYLFRLDDQASTELRLTTVARTPADRYRNHYLSPLFGAARVDGELWTANGASYTVTRLVTDGPGNWTKAHELPVGSWPAAIAHHPGAEHVLVAQRGSDTIGFIHRERLVLEDALWVGDEPTGLALSPDGARLYVTLPTMGAVAIVDVAARELVGRIDVGFDPRAIVVSSDGAHLYVASYRSGNRVKDTRGTYGPDDDQDIWIIDTQTGLVETVVEGVAADLRALALSPEGDELYVAATDGDPEPTQTDPSAEPFVHQVVVVGADPTRADFGTVLRRADLTRQPSSTGAVVNPSGILVTDDRVWVASEASDLVVALDRVTLEEQTRAAVGAGPRQLVALDDGAGGHLLAVHAHQHFAVNLLDSTGADRGTVPLTDDPRPPAVALGERVFTRPGGGFAGNHACSSCHVEAQNSGMIWNFGPSIWHNVRPLQLLDATTPLEWGAYVSSTQNFGYQGPSSIVGRPATPEEAEGLGAFLGSLLGAPRETGWTRLDGSYTDAALRGKALFEGEALCVGCHTPPLYTSRDTIDRGKSGVPADVPTLLGVYRHGIYFVAGQARGLPAALDVALDYVNVALTDDQRSDLLQFLYELTPKGAAPLGIWPDRDSNDALHADVRPAVTFADAIDDTQGKSAADVAADYLVLEHEQGLRVPGRVEITGHRLDFVPDAPLDPGATYRFRVLEGLPFLSGGALWGERVTEFTVARPATAAWPEAMTMIVEVPGPGGQVVPIPLALEPSATPRAGGLTLVVKPQLFGNQQRQPVWARLDGARFLMQPLALPINPTGVGDASWIEGSVTSVVGGNIAEIQGTLRITGPGITIPDVRFTITPTGP